MQLSLKSVKFLQENCKLQQDKQPDGILMTERRRFEDLSDQEILLSTPTTLYMQHTM